MEKHTSDRLNELMNMYNIKQVDILNMVKPLCDEYGEKINKSHLSQWVSGINEPNQRKLFILAKALNVSEPWLMGYDVPMARHNENIKVDKTKDFNFYLTASEVSLINKYRALDNNSRTFVDSILDREYERTFGPTLMAAHNDHIDDADEKEKVLEDLKNLKRP